MTAKQCTCNPSFETQTRFVGGSVKTTGSTMVRSTDPELQQSLPSLGEPVIFVSGSPRTPRSQSDFTEITPCYLPRGETGAASRTSRAPRTDRRPTPDRRTPPTAPHPQPHHPFPALGIRESEKFFFFH